MKTLALTLALAFSSLASADGFNCEQVDHSLRLKVFNQTQASSGVRNSAIMIFSDMNVGYGRKTIASFSSDKRTLGQSGTHYYAAVDLRVSESNRSGENLLGTKLGQLKEIFVEIDHNYSLPLEDGEEAQGTLTIVKRNGSSEAFDLVCTRYLKN